MFRIAESTTQTLRTQIYDITGFEWQIIFWLRWRYTDFAKDIRSQYLAIISRDI
jgi:hypothetical protein